MIILTLDPAASTGYCLLKITDKQATIFQQGFIDAVVSNSSYQGDHCISLMDKLEKIIDANVIEHIAIEDYFFSSSFATGSTVNVAYRTAIHILARKKNIPYTIINVGAWKKYVGGSSVPSKVQKEKWGPEAAKKLFIQEAIYKKYDIKFPNYSVSQKNGKPVKFRNDIVDAVAQAIYFCYEKYGIVDVASSVVVPPDHEFKKTPKNTYVYPSI